MTVNKDKKRTSKISTDLQRQKKHILVVDDEQPVVSIEKEILENNGYRVTMHTNGREALASFIESPNEFDLVITDFSMPGMDGIQLSTKISKLRHDIPVILISGLIVIPETEASKAGIIEIIMKPVRAKELCRLVRGILGDISKKQTVDK